MKDSSKKSPRTISKKTDGRWLYKRSQELSKGNVTSFVCGRWKYTENTKSGVKGGCNKESRIGNMTTRYYRITQTVIENIFQVYKKLPVLWSLWVIATNLIDIQFLHMVIFKESRCGKVFSSSLSWNCSLKATFVKRRGLVFEMLLTELPIREFNSTNQKFWTP